MGRSRSSKTVNLTATPSNHTVKHYLGSHLSACKIGLQNLLNNPIATLIIVLTLGISLCLPASGYIILKNLDKASSGWDKGTTITLFLKHNPDQMELHNFISSLQNAAAFSKIEYQSPDEALEEFRKLNDVGQFIDTLPSNPLPGVITLYPKPEFEEAKVLKAVQDKLQENTIVDQATLDFEWVQKLNAFLQLSQALAILFSLIIGIGVILVICNTVRLALERHRNEIEVLSLIGATQSFIRRPFLYRGLWYGVLGAGAAFALIYLAQLALKVPTANLSELYGNNFNLETITLSDTILLLLASLSLGWFGAWVAVWHQWQTLAPESSLKP